MKLFFEIITLVLFFVVYQMYDLQAAVLLVVIAYTLFTAASFIKHRRLGKMQLVTFILVVVLGGATLLLQDELFFKWKPTVVSWLFAGVLLGSTVLMKKNLLQRMASDNLTLPEHVWARLNVAWILFFTGLGAINLFVVYNFDTTVWVYFKLFGAVGLLLAFFLVQCMCLWRYIAVQTK